MDFVLTWVSDQDEAWRRAREEALAAVDHRLPEEGAARIRNWGTLRYWFRAVETYAGWVRRIHFVTDTAVPAWLVEQHPKLRVVPDASLYGDGRMRFNSLAVETCLHRIPDLAEQFVYFNDDFFLSRPLSPRFYFRRGVPYGYPFPFTLANTGAHAHAVLNAAGLINDHFGRAQYLRSVRRRSLRPASGRDLLRYPLLLASRRIPPATDLHLPLPLLKSAVTEAFAAAPEMIEQTRNSTFRSRDNVHSMYFAAMWQLAQGRYFAISKRRAGRYVALGSDPIERIEAVLADPRVAQVCVNDESDRFDPELARQLVAAFERKLPHLSSFERD